MNAADKVNSGNHFAAGTVIVLISTVCWASAGLFVRLLPFDIWSIIVWRNVFAVLFVGSYILWQLRGTTLQVIRRLGLPGWLATACLMFTNIAFPAALQNGNIGKVLTIYASLPLLTAALEWLLYRTTPSVVTVAAGILAVIGILIMVGPSTGGPQISDLLALLSTISMAFLTLLIRRNSAVNMLPVSLLSILLSGFIAWPLADHVSSFGARDLLVVAAFALFQMALGLMLYVIGSALIPATLSTLIQTMEAPFGVLWVWIGIGEAPNIPTIIGGMLVLSGVFGRLLLEHSDSEANRPT